MTILMPLIVDSKQRLDYTMTDKLKSWMTYPFFEVVLGSSEVVVSNNYLIKHRDIVAELYQVKLSSICCILFITYRMIASYGICIKSVKS